MSSNPLPSIIESVPTGLLAAYFAVFGMVVGSYLNVVAHRLPLGVSTVMPRSRCPRCLMPIRPWHNVPVLGWVTLGGRCFDCKVSIPVRYPATEAATGGLFLVSWLRFDSLLGIAVAAGSCALFVVLAAIDVDHHLLPVAPMRWATLAALALQPWLGWVPPMTALLTAIVAAALLWLLSLAWQRVHGTEGFGRGDVELVALVGALLGPGGVLPAFILGASIALVSEVLRLLVRGRGAAFAGSPFGACLAVGAIVVLLVRGGECPV